MAKQSAGLLMYRKREGRLEVLLVHPGGPFWAKKDLGAWSIPKGEFAGDEDALSAAIREFQEETGLSAHPPFLPLGSANQSGKRVQAWAFEGDCDPETLVSNQFEMEWPPRSGKRVRFAEVDRGAWFALPEARGKMLAAQVQFLERLGSAGRPAVDRID